MSNTHLLQEQSKGAQQVMFMKWMDAVTENVHSSRWGSHPWMGRAALRSPQLGRVVPQAETGSSACVRPLLGEEAPLSQESELIQGPNIDPEPICTQKPPNLEPTSIGRQLLFPGPTCAETTLALNSEGLEVPKDTERWGENDKNKSQ